MNLVVSMAKDDIFNHHRCIICQEDTKSPVTSEKTGRASVKRAAEIHNDIVTKRIKSLMGDDNEDNDIVAFVYHNTNKCYKSYTHSGKLKSLPILWSLAAVSRRHQERCIIRKGRKLEPTRGSYRGFYVNLSRM